MRNDMTENKFTRPLSVKLFITFGLMLVGLFLLSLLSTTLNANGGEQSKYVTLLIGVFQNLVVFAMAAVGMSKICYGKVATPLKLNVAPSWKGIALVVALYVVSMPALNWLVDWNEHITFPDSMHQIYETLKKYENIAQEQTKLILKGNDFFTMLLMVLQVGLLTGFGEEIFFRGAILGAFEREKRHNVHVSVWCVGILFSAFHFQFFGFFPRCYLGILLGYLYVWSGSLWLPVICHAINNSMVVINTYLIEHGVGAAASIENIGIPQPGHFPFLALASAALTITLLYVTHKALKATH